MTMKRAYSTLEIKAMDGGEKRRFTGMATTPTADRVGDIVEPKGASFKLPIPLLWQHDHRQPIGWVTAAKVSDKGIEIEGEVADIPEDGELKDRLLEAWQSIKHGLVRGLSIGFRSIESADIQGSWAQRFLKWEWLELSAVTIAANGEASIQTIKSIDTETRAALGLTRKGVVRLDPSPGDSGTKKPAGREPVFFRPEKGNDMKKTLAEQISAFEAMRAAKAARQTEIQTKAADEGRTKDAAEKEEFSTLTDEIKQIDEELVDLRAMEKQMLAAPATQRVVENGKPSGEAAPLRLKEVEKLDKGIEFARFVMCHVAAKGNPQMAFNLAAKHFPNNERLVNTIKAQSEGYSLASVMKANVNAGTSLDSTWAAPLVQYQNFAGDFVEFLRPQTILGKFGMGNVPALNRIPFNVRIAGQTSGGSGYWVGEGKPKPLTKFDFAVTELRWAKVANIAVLTEELMRFSDPSAERLVRDALAAALIARLDTDFVDPDKAATANVSPASITNGISEISSTGSDADAVRRDIRALWAPFITANNPPTTAVYIMSATRALALSLMVNTLGQPEFPGITMNGGTLNGIPVIVSEYLKNDGGSAGDIVILVNARDIWLADDGQITIDASREASLQMDDAPTNDSATGTETSVVSMFQTNSVALRAERYINWARRRSSAVSWLGSVTWAP